MSRTKDRLCVWWWNFRFNLGYRIGGFTSAQNNRESRCVFAEGHSVRDFVRDLREGLRYWRNGEGSLGDALEFARGYEV